MQANSHQNRINTLFVWIQWDSWQCGIERLYLCKLTCVCLCSCKRAITNSLKIRLIFILTELGTLEWWISRSMLDPLFFFNLETNQSWTCHCMYKIQTIRVAYQKPGYLKFCAPFKINIQKREGLSKFEKPVFDFSVPNTKKRVD